MEENILGTEKIGKLVMKFAVPCVISMVVAALYNIVDQIFIGWSEAGAYGNAATNIVYPLTVFALGFALLVGDGASANFSLFLGAGEDKKAERSIGSGLVMLVGVTAVITAAALILKKQILGIFGADPQEELCYAYAMDYYGVIALGLPLYMIGQGLNSFIRADGSPRYSMACTLAGAICNIILDPVFIFALKMGVKGAAIATVIGQLLTFVMSVVYLLRAKHVRLNAGTLTPDGKLLGRIVSLGMASLIVQLSIMAVITVENNLFARYGYETLASTGAAYGAVVPLAVVGIVMKVFGIVISIVVGVGVGGMPIIGYNMGARNVQRVKQCVGYITKSVLLLGMVAFLIFELAPNAVISLFGTNNSPEYTEYARLCMRIFLGGIALTCYVKASAIILQGMGSSAKSTIISLMRDVFVFIPSSLIIASLSHNIVTLLWAAVIADVVSAVVAFLMVHTELRKKERLLSSAQPEN